MGLDIDAALSIGYTIDLDLVPDRYRLHIEKLAHFEERYDSKTPTTSSTRSP